MGTLTSRSIDPAVARKNRNQDIWLIIAVALFFIIKFCVPATGGLTVEAAEGVTLTTGDAYTLTFSLTAEDGTELTAFTLDVTIS